MQAFDWLSLNRRFIVGVDEVGRGCLAGPVYAAAVILDTQKPYKHFKDSKTLRPERRKLLAEEIKQNHRYAVGFATVEEIEELNILWAALLAMKRAVDGLQIPESDKVDTHILVDGKFTIPKVIGIQQTCLIKGDQRAEPIAAASILAKVTRDERITEIGQVYPQYGFAEHKAYGTSQHKAAIAKYGPCPEHRRGFAGVKEHC